MKQRQSSRVIACGPSVRCQPIDFPKSDVMKYYLEGGDWVTIRPSGTEPKLKLYVSAHADTKEQAAEKAAKLLENMKGYVE